MKAFYFEHGVSDEEFKAMVVEIKVNCRMGRKKYSVNWWPKQQGRGIPVGAARWPR
jgi:hypothetical protein